MSKGVGFDGAGGHYLAGGESSDVLFTSYPLGAIETAIAEGAGVRFEILPADPFSPAFETGAVMPVLVPEPGRTLLARLVTASLALLTRCSACAPRARATGSAYVGRRSSSPPAGAGRARWL
jgi:hypothetical protein